MAARELRDSGAAALPEPVGDPLVPVGGKEVLVAHALRGSGRSPKFSTDPDAALRAINKTGTVSVDLETKGLHPHGRDAAIGAVILHADKKNFILRELPDWWPEVLASADIKKIGHNLKFDLMWMIEFNPDQDTDLTYARNTQDTMLKSQLSHTYRTKAGAAKAGFPTAYEPNDLKSVLAEFGWEIAKSVDHSDRWTVTATVKGKEKSKEFEDHMAAVRWAVKHGKRMHDVEQTAFGVDWTGPWDEPMIEYMLEDIQYLEELDSLLDDDLAERGQTRAADIEMDCVFASAWMQLNGIQPDVQAWEETVAGWVTTQSGYIEQLQTLWPGVSNYNSTQQLMETAQQVLGFSLPNIQKSTLKQMAATTPPIALLSDQRQMATYLKSWGLHYLQEYLCITCGRFHPGWNQIGTETSRYSCSRPNLQQIPRAPEFRRLFVASPGTSLASLDYSAIEVLTAAIFADDRTLMKACATGDPHLATAQMISSEGWTGDYKIDKNDPRRQGAKIANFGLLFGGGAKGLVDQAKNIFDVVMSVEDAQTTINTYYKLYPGLSKTRNWAYRAMDLPDKAIWQENKIGFKRVLEGKNRKATSWLNTWIQSTAQYGIKNAMRLLRESALLPYCVGQIHDEILFEFPDEQAEEYAEVARQCMVLGMKEVLGMRVPIHVDKKIGKTWL